MDGIDKQPGLHDVLLDAQLTRDVVQVGHEFALCGINLWQQICEKLQSLDENEDFVLLDAGCGSGNALEEFLQMSHRIKAIGLDLQPRPELIHLSEPSAPMADLRTGSVCDMPIDDNSVDIGYSVATLIYVTDSLRALEEGYRVLKPGGKFFWDIHRKDVSYFPDFDIVLDVTPGAREVFEFIPSSGKNAGCIRCAKHPNVEFNGFNYEVVRELALCDDDVVGVESFFRNAVYRSLWYPQAMDAKVTRRRPKPADERFRQFLERVIADARAARFPIRFRHSDCERFNQFPLKLNALWSDNDIEGIKREINAIIRVMMLL